MVFYGRFPVFGGLGRIMFLCLGRLRESLETVGTDER